MDTESNIESYHGPLKRWLNAYVRGLRGRIVDWLLWSFSDPVSNNLLDVT